MTVGEILDYSKAFVNRENNRYRAEAVLCYKLGQLVGYAFNAPKGYPGIREVFPDIFDGEKTGKQDWKVMRERIMRYGEMKKNGEK